MGARSLTARAQLGSVARRHRDDPLRIADARRELAAAKIADYIEAVVDSAPPLSLEQCDRLALLLRPTSDGAAA